MLSAVLDYLNSQLLGKPEQIRLALACLLSRGHLLIEDQPGSGKTTLAKALAEVFSLSFNRVQFTSDMLPADLVGVSIYDKTAAQFQFHPGPIFCQFLLADEINRASPRTQSALLEAMAEQQVSVDGQHLTLDAPFFVVATQNPLDSAGTQALPESQLDRFAARISLGFPAPEIELAILKQVSANPCIAPKLPMEQLLDWQLQVEHVTITDHVLRYILALAQFTRSSDFNGRALSTRALKSLVAMSKANAWLNGLDFVQPDDVQACFIACCAHRIANQQQGYALALDVLQRCPVPR